MKQYDDDVAKDRTGSHCGRSVRKHPRCNWVVAETLAGPDHPSTVVDGQYPRSFTRLNHSSVARVAAAASRLTPLIQRCADSSTPEDECYTAPDGRAMQMIALPVIGLSGQVDAVTVWTGARTDPLPPPPNVGSIEWNASGVFTGTSAAQFLLRLSYADIPSVHTVPEILAGFDHWDDRAGFFDLFNLDNPADRWAGTATKTYEDGNPHRLHIAARASGCGIARTVRAIVCDVTDDEALVVPDLLSIAVRHMPIPPGHALGLVDLKTGFVHEWLADERTPLAGWRHHNPEIDNSGKLLVATTCIELATGVRQTANTKARIRFNPTDDWILLSARWNRINNGPRPQALIDVTPISPIPTPPVGKCRVCQDLLRHMDYRQAASTE